MALRIDIYGPEALLVRFAETGDMAAFARGQALLRHIEKHPPVGLLEATPGFTTLLLEFETGRRPEPAFLGVLLEGALRSARRESVPGRMIRIPVMYDGPDLERVAARASLSVAQVIDLHARGNYVVQLLGFAPGFPYISGLDPRLHTPRLPEPRPRVPAGSVAIGGEHTAVYPVATAGGWNLIGRTEFNLIDGDLAGAANPDAFRLRPGDTVRFVATPAA